MDEMPPPEPVDSPERVDPATVPAERLVVPTWFEAAFEGWQPQAFALLERLREHPHIEQYRIERDSGRLDRYLKEPFKRYRDDLVVGLVLPNRLRWETERNVFSRLLKNDFGAGGCHHHKWLAFYRPPRRRLTDVQLSHSLWPDGLDVGLFVGGYAKDLVRQARAHVAEAPEQFLSAVNPLLAEGTWRLGFETGSGAGGERHVFEAPPRHVPEAVGRARALWLRRRFRRERVIAWGPGVMRHVLGAVCAVWPLYRFCLRAAPAS